MLRSVAIAFVLLTSAFAEHKEYEDYRPFIAGQKTCTAWFGERTAIVLENEKPEDRSPEVMATICAAFDGIFNAYDRITGVKPRLTAPLEGRIRVEVSKKVGGGLASHGTLGIAVGPGFFHKLYDRVESGKKTYDQIFFYEIARNYWTSDMNPAIDYHTLDGESSYGWWTVGFNNAMSVFLPEQIEEVEDMFYFGRDADAFAEGMTGKLDIYLKGKKEYTWENTWCRDRLPWRQKASLNDLMTGLLIRLYREHGEAEFIKSLYREIPKQRPLVERRDNYQRARDNFYKAASIAARKDLWDYFMIDLRWPVSDEARAIVTEAVGAEADKSGLRAFTNTEGKTFEGRVLRLEGDMVVLLGSNERAYKYPMAKFSEDDQDFIRRLGL